MAITVSVHDEILDVVVEGDHSLQEFYDGVNVALDSPEWSGTGWLLIDVRLSPAVTHRTPREVRELCEFLGARPGRFRRCAALVVSSDVQREVLRIAETRADFDGNDVRCFFSRKEATEWLLSHEVPDLLQGPTTSPVGSDRPSASS